MRIIGIHRVAAEVVARLGGKLTKPGRVPMLREHLEAFGRECRTFCVSVIWSMLPERSLGVDQQGNSISVSLPGMPLRKRCTSRSSTSLAEGRTSFRSSSSKAQRW